MKHRLTASTLALAHRCLSQRVAGRGDSAGGKGQLYAVQRRAAQRQRRRSVPGAGRRRQPRRAPRADSAQSQNQVVHDRLDAPRSSIWSHGVPARRHHRRPQAGRLTCTVDVRAPRGSSLPQIESTPAGTPRRPRRAVERGAEPLWLFVGTVTGAAVGRPRRAARRERQLAGAAGDARPVARPVVHLRRRHDLPALAGQACRP